MTATVSRNITIPLRFTLKIDGPKGNLRKLLDIHPKSSVTAYTRTKVRTIQVNAAAQAERTAKLSFESKRLRQSFPPSRPGRQSTMGRMSEAINYHVMPAGKPGAGLVALDMEMLDTAAQSSYAGGTAFYWRVQEIGSGHTASVFHHVSVGTRARPGAMQAEVLTTWNYASQIGRGISKGLAWSSEGTKFTAPSAAGRGLRQNLWLVADAAKLRSARQKGGHFTSVKQRNRMEAGLVIKKEIPAKHYIKVGSVMGYKALEGRTIAEVKKLF